MTQLVLSQSEEIATASEPWIQLFLLGQSYTLPKHPSNRTQHLPLIAFNDLKQTLKDESQRELCREISQAFYGKFTSKGQIFLDKTPRYFLILNELKKTYPDAKFILLKRDPEAVFQSILNTWHKGKKMDRVARGHYEDLFLAPHKIQDFLDQEQENPNVFSIKYEDLISDAQAQFKKLFYFLNLPFSQDYLNYGSGKSLSGSLGDPTGVQQYESPYASTVKPALSKKQSQYIEWYINYLGSDFLRHYGYDKSVSGGVTSKAFQNFHDYGKSFFENQGSLKEELRALLKYYMG